MNRSISGIALGFAFAVITPQPQEAPAGFDNKSNGVVDDATHQSDKQKFDDVEGTPRLQDRPECLGVSVTGW